MANHSSVIARGTPMNNMKRQKDKTPEDDPPQVRRYSICYWGKGYSNY